MLVLKFLEAVVKGDHACLHLANRVLDEILEVVDLLNLVVLPFDHEIHLVLSTFLESAELVDPLNYLLIDSLLQLVQLGYLLLVEGNNDLHSFDGGVGVDMGFGGLLIDLCDLLVLELDVSGFLGLLPFEQEVMVLQFFQHAGLDAFHLVNFDGILGLLLAEGLQQLAHDLPNLGLDLIPLELPDLPAVLLLLRHYFIYMAFKVNMMMVGTMYHSSSPAAAAASSAALSASSSAISCSLSFFL